MSSGHTPYDKIPSAFIITGPSIASQELLFEQLSETLQAQAQTKTVRLRSGDASNLKAVLKKIIHNITTTATEEGDDPEVAVGKDVSLALMYCRHRFPNIIFRHGSISATILKRSTLILRQILTVILLLHFKIVRPLIAVSSRT